MKNSRANGLILVFGLAVLALAGCFNLGKALVGSPQETGLVVVSCEAVLTDSEVGRHGKGVIPILLSVLIEDKASSTIKEVALKRIGDGADIVQKKFFRHERACAIFSGLSPGTYQLSRIKAQLAHSDEPPEKNAAGDPLPAPETDLEFVISSEVSAPLTFEVLPGKVNYVNLLIKREIPGYRGDRPGFAKHTIKSEDLDLTVSQEIGFWNAFLGNFRKKRVNSPWEEPARKRLAELNEQLSQSNEN